MENKVSPFFLRFISWAGLGRESKNLAQPSPPEDLTWIQSLPGSQGKKSIHCFSFTGYNFYG